MTIPWQGDEENVDYSMVWRFINQSSDFVYGIEAGILYEQMRRGDDEITTTVHTENEEELRNLANSLEYSLAVEPIDATWCRVTCRKPSAGESEKPKNVHTVREHVTEGLDCWCKPTYNLPCDECKTGCWKCNGGLIAIPREQAEEFEGGIIIVHNE